MHVEDLQADLQKALRQVPRHLFVDRLDALPFTDSGKIDKRRLAEILAERIARAGG